MQPHQFAYIHDLYGHGRSRDSQSILNSNIAVVGACLKETRCRAPWARIDTSNRRKNAACERYIFQIMLLHARSTSKTKFEIVPERQIAAYSDWTPTIYHVSFNEIFLLLGMALTTTVLCGQYNSLCHRFSLSRTLIFDCRFHLRHPRHFKSTTPRRGNF